MIIETLEVGVFAENCYIIGCTATRAGVVIDPGDEAARILDKIQSLGLDIRDILLTHGHIDHVKDVPLVRESLKVPVLMHSEDQFLVDNLPAQAAAFGIQITDTPKIDRYINEKARVTFGHVTLSIVHTPGHSPGSITFCAEGLAFSGDILFARSVGRTDLPGGNFATLMESINHKLLPLGDHVEIFPGHGPKTTVEQERKFNPFLTNTNNN